MVRPVMPQRVGVVKLAGPLLHEMAFVGFSVKLQGAIHVGWSWLEHFNAFVQSYRVWSNRKHLLPAATINYEPKY